MTSKRGFTLIELLVVIAIIGILSSVVLASLNTARDKGADAAAKANLNNMRAQAELIYDDQTSTRYSTVCSNATIVSAVNSARTATGDTSTDYCNSATSSWAANVKMKSVANTWFCIDSSGQATTTATDTISSATDYSCN